MNSSVFITLQQAQVENRQIVTADVKTAFYNATLEREIIMILNADVTRVVLELRPEWATYVRSGNKTAGTMLVQIDLALYGLPECSKLWYDRLVSLLTFIGFTMSTVDQGLFYMTAPCGSKVTLVVHVDDMLITSESLDLLRSITESLRKELTGITVLEGDNHKFLGMCIAFDREAGRILVTQSQYTKTICELKGITTTAPTPGNEAFNRLSIGTPLSPKNQNQFLRELMRAMYLATRTRPEILYCTTQLARQSCAANTEDQARLTRVFAYLNGTKELGLQFSGQERKRQLFVSADASYAEHNDSKSHSGIAMALGQGTGSFYSVSKKQSIVARASAEAELITLDPAAHEAAIQIMILHELDLLIDPAIILQDNEATMRLANAGKPLSRKSKHIKNALLFD